MLKLNIISILWKNITGVPLAAKRRFALELVAAGGLLALATAGFFWQILFTPATWMPAGGGDLASFLYPNYYFAATKLRQGQFPLWNPHLYSGAPFAADIQSGLFYPLNWLFFLFAPLSYEWLEYLAVFHFWLAGATMYLCLRLLRPDAPLAPLAAFGGALAFEFSDLFIVHFGNLNMIAVAAWLPLVFLLFHRSLTGANSRLAAAAGAVLAVATLAGHIQITLFILLALGLYALWGWGLRPLVLLVVCVAVTVGLSALLLLPAYEMSSYTPRAELPYEEAARYSLHPAQLIGLLVPDYFGRDPALHWGPWERVETGYIGIITLILAMGGALLCPGRLKRYLVALGVLALLLAMGGYAPLHGWLYRFVPGFDQLRAPARFILLLDFSLAMLAALGLDRLLCPLPPADGARWRKLLKIVGWSLGGLIVAAAPLSYYAMLVTQDRDPAIFNRATAAASGVATFAFFALAALAALHFLTAGRRWAGPVTVALIGLDLFTLGGNVDVGHNYPAAGFEHPAALEFLRRDPALYRVEVATDVWHVWQPNTALLYGLDDVWGLYNPLTLADTTLYWSGVGARSGGRYNFLGVKYIIGSKAGAPADGDIVPVFDQDPDINIYLNRSALTRALFVGRAVVVPTHDAAWAAVRADGFDPATTVILESGVPLSNTPQSSLTITRYDPEQITIQVETDQAGYLVLPDAYYPGWRAEVDGQPAPIHRANFAFRAVYVPEGMHTVQWIFDPLLWKTGLAISAATLVMLGGWLGVAVWHARRNRVPPRPQNVL
jgi:hypothetical protein